MDESPVTKQPVASVGVSASSPSVDKSPNELTVEERFALRELMIKCTDEGLHGFNRLDLAQHLVVAKCDIEKAVRRMHNIQKLRDEHKLQQIDSIEALDFVVKNAPGLMEPCGPDRDGRSILYMVAKHWNPSTFTDNEKSYRYMLRFLFDWFYTAATTLDEVRLGCVVLSGCDDMGWNNFSLEMERKMSWMYQDGFPLMIKGMYMVDSPMMARALINLCKPFLKKKLRDRIFMINSDPRDDVEKVLPMNSAPKSLGGSYDMDVMKWFAQRLEERAQSIRELSELDLD